MATILALNAALLRRNHQLHTTRNAQRDTAADPRGLRPGFSAIAAYSANRPIPLSGSYPWQAAPDGPDVASAAPRIADLIHGQVLLLVLTGHPGKNSATHPGVNRRTVAAHRAAITRRSGATSLPALARMAVGWFETGDCR